MPPSSARSHGSQPISTADRQVAAGQNKRSHKSFQLQPDLPPLFVVFVGFILRLIPASQLFLNPDEALHDLLASQSSLARTWAAALTNAHPPLLILVLHYWQSLGHSELWLRLPSVIAGTLACWFFYLWLKRIAGRTIALVGLLLFAFAPSLILLSAEIRQYSLLLFFETACLYLSESAIQENSPARMALFSLSLYGALLTHYSALMFAFAIGLYLLLRLFPFRRGNLAATWAAGQFVGIAIAAYFLLTHVRKLRQTGMVRADLESYLRRAVYQPGGRNPLTFLAAQTLRVFTYLFSHGLIGTLVLICFLLGIGWLFHHRGDLQNRPTLNRSNPAPSSGEIAVLLVLPFVVNWAVSLAGLYPLGATRHSSFLAPFAIAGACVGIGWIPARAWTKELVVVLALAICNLFPAPPPPIRPRDQSRALMVRAVAQIQTLVPSGSFLLTDYESGLLLGYYLCHHGVVQIFPPLQDFSLSNCGSYKTISTSFHDWKFTAQTFPAELSAAKQFTTAFGASDGSEIWLFYAGWINDSEPALKQELERYGCSSPQMFGENILICRLKAE